MGLIDLFYRVDGQTAASLRDRLLNERAERLARRLELLDAHLNRCKREVALYRDLPSVGDPLERLRQVPPYAKTGRPAFATDACSSVATHGKRWDHTSGTSGITFHFLVNREEIALRRAYEQVANKLLGLEPNARHLVIWGGHESKNLRTRIRNGLYSALVSRELQIVAGADHNSCLRLAPRIAAHHNGVLITYPSILAGLCDVGMADVLRSYKAIILTGEAVRMDVFSQWKLDNLRNRYGTREFGAIAIGMGDPLFYFGDRFILEHDDSLGLLVTDLGKRAMPLLRYPVGDFAFDLKRTMEPQPPWGLPRLGIIEGRVFDTVLGRSGRRYIGTFWTLTMRQVGVERFRISQTQPGQVEVQYVAVFDDEELRSRLWPLLKDDFQLVLRRCDNIPELANAKQKIVVSSAY